MTESGGSITAASVSALSPGVFNWSSGKLGIGGAVTSMNAQGVTSIGVTSLSSYTAGSGSAVRSILVASGVTFAGRTNAWTGQLDLAGNDMIVTGGGSLGLANLTNQIRQGFNAGRWNGSAGILSSTAAANNSHLTALGIILNNNGSGTPIYYTFDGSPSGSTDVLVKYTYYGDANLDGTVDGSDYSRVDNGFQHNLQLRIPGRSNSWICRTHPTPIAGPCNFNPVKRQSGSSWRVKMRKLRDCPPDPSKFLFC